MRLFCPRRDPVKGRDLITARKDLTDCFPLAFTQARMLRLDLRAHLDASDFLVLTLALAHQANYVALMSEHLSCRERPAWNVLPLIHLD